MEFSENMGGVENITKSKIYFFLRILISILPFIALILSIIEKKRYEYWVPPIYELIAIGLLVFSILYLLIELRIMQLKKMHKKVRNNTIIIVLMTLCFFIISYSYALWK